MSPLPDGVAGAPRHETGARRGSVDDGQGLLIRSEAYDGPIAQSLVAAFIVDIEERYAGDDEPDDPEAEWSMGVEEVTPPRGISVVAYLEGEPIGCGAIRLYPAAGPNVAEIKRMYTVPSARHRGVSRAVLTRLESEAVRLGYRRLQLETGLRQPEAVALYESSGYHRIPNFGLYAASELSACFAKDMRSR